MDQSRTKIICNVARSIREMDIKWADIHIENLGWNKCARYPSIYVCSTNFPNVVSNGRDMRLTFMLSVIVVAQSQLRQELSQTLTNDDMIESIIDKLYTDRDVQKSCILFELEKITVAPLGSLDSPVKAQEIMYKVIYSRERKYPK